MQGNQYLEWLPLRKMGHESVPPSWIGVKVSRSHRKDKEIVDC